MRANKRSLRMSSKAQVVEEVEQTGYHPHPMLHISMKQEKSIRQAIAISTLHCRTKLKRSLIHPPAGLLQAVACVLYRGLETFHRDSFIRGFDWLQTWPPIQLISRWCIF